MASDKWHREPIEDGSIQDDRRIDPDDRRIVTRSGRRHSDPRPTCPSCGLRVDRPHGSDTDCIAALREQIAARKRGEPG